MTKFTVTVERVRIERATVEVEAENWFRAMALGEAVHVDEDEWIYFATTTNGSIRAWLADGSVSPTG